VSAYIARRLLSAIPVLFGVAVATFAIVHLTPGDPVVQILGIHATPGAVNELRHQLGLDRPLPAQFLHFVGGAVTGDFGTSITKSRPVGELLSSRALPSLWLILYTLVVALAVSIPLAILAAMRANRFADHAVRLTTTIGFAMPGFWVGLLLALIFAVDLGWFPVSGYGTGFGGVLRSLTLPAVTLALSLIPILTRSLRASLVETLNRDFVEALRGRGIKERQVILRHALRNSLMSTITIVAVSIGYLIGGTVVVENVFQIPGLGTLLVQSILARDYPVIEAMTLIFGVVVVLANLQADILYALVDPRVRLRRS
jgi:peptide/nickel transport system permease protein